MQFTHHEVQGGEQKNLEAEGRVIFAPTPSPFSFYPTIYLGNHFYFYAGQFLKISKEYITAEVDSVQSAKRIVLVTLHLLVTS